ncbi:uncharacterized protein [Linepithema humile]|uniref:uncharacterized protein n=1 Tax=Linepithema humile TaxID=83485 RepID=UPI00351DD9B2
MEGAFHGNTRGVEGRAVRGERRGQGEGEEEEDELDKEEVRKVVRALRDGKAAGIDEVPAEVWKYGGEDLEEWIWGFCNRVRKGEVNKQLGGKKGNMVAVFVDLKAAFDSVERGVLMEAMRERGIRGGLVVKVEEILRETRSRVRVGGETGEVFWTARGVKQGCPLSPLLFNVVTADLEEEMEKEEEMGSMLERLEGYLERKRLELNVKKTKILRFRMGGRMGKKVWRWRGKVIEEVKEFKYLGLVWTVMGYGAEIWGWKEREMMKKLEERYLKWVLGVDGRTPGYMVREELKREKLRGRAGKRAWEFERRLEEGKGSDLAKKCRWIGRGGPIVWPARSPDLNVLDYFVWGYIKALVEHKRDGTENEL